MSAAIELTSVTKDYHSLRPLRIRNLVVQPAERVALLGLESGAAAVVLDLLAGATLPDEGEVRVHGRSTRAIETPGAWFESLDMLGLVTARAVLLESLSVLQNIALATTVRVEPMSRADAISARALAAEVGIGSAAHGEPVGAVGTALRLRIRLARALAPEPTVLVLEHPTAELTASEAAAWARDLSRVATDRRLAVLLLTHDARVGKLACHRTVRLRPATGRVSAVGWTSRLPWVGR